MRIIKRLHIFVLRSFLPLFAMTFFIVLFIVLMQFLWKYIDDLVGKGLSIDVLGELFFYAAVSMVPMALPLSILLASLMTFGNFGEKFELTAMKASGISLVRVMAPLIIFISAISVGAFFFQNDVLPKAQVKMWTLLFSMRQKSPEVEIPQGVFYDQIPNYSLFVKSKNQETGMLYGTMIYDVHEGGDNSTILMADSAQLAFTPDMKYLYLHLFNGEQFENLREQRTPGQNVPFRRETFFDKQILIPFDANFNRLDEQGMRKQYVGKNITELRQTIDSVGCKVDSIGRVNATALSREMAQQFGESKKSKANKDAVTMAFDTLLQREDVTTRSMIYETAASRARGEYQNYEFRSTIYKDETRVMRRHQIELMKKFTLSVACLVFFFIGAPLGAIIRKGGIGTPLVISVFLFVIYYIVDNTGYKMARDGVWAVWFGMWLSTMVLAPLGVYVTYKAMNDSAVFDKDAWIRFINRLTRRSDKERKVSYKEVIFNEISVPVAIERFLSIREEALSIREMFSRPCGYSDYFTTALDTDALTVLSHTLDDTIEYMADCPDKEAVGILHKFPIFRAKYLYSPACKKWLGKTLKYIFPIGVCVWLAGKQQRKELVRNLDNTANLCNEVVSRLEKV